MNDTNQSLGDLRREVDRIIASLSPREAQAFKMMLSMKLINQTPEQQNNILARLTPGIDSAEEW